jgi:hypothetical protein
MIPRADEIRYIWSIFPRMAPIFIDYFVFLTGPHDHFIVIRTWSGGTLII